MSGTGIGAIDIGGTKIAVGVVDESGLVLVKLETPTQSAGRYSQALQSMAAMLRLAAQQAGVTLKGIGIGSTGPLDPVRGIFGDLDTIPQWSGEAPVNDLGRLFGIPVAMENDADAGALAEQRWGAGRDKSRLIYVTFGTGIGGGIILDGQLYRGVDGAHPELGHQVLEFSGPPCSCGLNGCWEALAAGPAMAKWMRSQPEYDGNGAPTAKEIYALATAGEALARRTVQRETYLIGVGLANLVNLFTPDAIVMGGSVMKGAGRFLPEIRSVMEQGCRFVPLEKVELRLASLGEDANLLGAAHVWHHRFAQ